MSSIPVYTQSPINASKASTVTPQTAAPQTQTIPLAPNSAAASTTTIASLTSSYPPARQGAAVVSAPTASAQQYAPMQATRTTHRNDGPSAPQPGAFPTPLNSLRSNLPPPPKAGETYQPPQRTTTAAPSSSMPQPYPPQMSIPPPTSMTTTASSAYLVSLPNTEYGTPRRSFEHPPGYYQNVYASELSSDQKRAQDANNTSGLGDYDDSGKAGGAATFEMDPESVWNTAKKWAQTAGEKISEAETEVWRRINKD